MKSLPPKSDWIDNRIVSTDNIGDHFSFNISRQILPCKSTLGSISLSSVMRASANFSLANDEGRGMTHGNKRFRTGPLALSRDSWEETVSMTSIDVS